MNKRITKMHILFLFTTAIFYISNIYSQINLCGTTQQINKSSKKMLSNKIQRGGKYLPAEGTIKGLIIFVQFLDDNAQNDIWKLNEIPLWADELTKRVKTYFSEMSFGKLNLELDAYPSVCVTSKKEIEYTYYSVGYAWANKEALAQVDKSISFLPYDNWIVDNNYELRAGQDGSIDLVIMVYRRINYKNILPFYGISDLGFAHRFAVDNGKRFIWGGYPGEDHKDASSSGVSVCNAPGSGNIMDLYSAEKLLCHEVSHKFLGEGHIIYNFTFLGQMSNAYGGAGFHSFERASLGYMDFIKIDSNQSKPVILNDYMTTGEAIIIEPIKSVNQYYILENRQKISPYDGAARKGLFIYQVTYAGENSTIDIQTADGKWDWELKPNYIVQKTNPNPKSGKSHLELVTLNDVDYYPPQMEGNEFDPFYPGYKTIYSPWTNPCSNAKQSGLQSIFTDISVNLLSMEKNQIKLNVNFRSSVNILEEFTKPGKIELMQNYPNPFNASTQIEYLIPSKQYIELSVFNSTGQKICDLFKGMQEQGKYKTYFDAINLSSGIYFYRLKADNTIFTKKLMLLK